MNRQLKRTVLVLYDFLALLAASLLSYLFLETYVIIPPKNFFITILLSGILYFSSAMYFRLFSKITRYTSISETIIHIILISTSFLLTTIVMIPIVSGFSFRFTLLTYIFSVASIPGGRVMWRIYQEHQQKLIASAKGENVAKIRTLIVGAGDGGSLFIKSLQRHSNGIELIGLVDDDKAKQSVYLYGVPVVGSIEDIPEIVALHNVQQITIAIPTLSAERLNRIVDICTAIEVRVNQMPSIEDVVQGKLAVNKFKDIDVTDLLGRDEVTLDMNRIARQLTGKTVLVSGAGGSIGSEICRQIIRFSPKNILLLGHGENSIYLIHKELMRIKDDETELIPVIADIQDYNRVISVMKKYKPNLVYHAAAHKHVPLMEYNPIEAVKNNIHGTKNIARASKIVGVDNFVMVSTDKAVNPPNVMGATKRIAEMIVTSLNENDKTKFTAVRFGNVLGSRGSVIPLFKEQIKNGGPVTVTDFRMTRYFMTIPEASRLVLQAGALSRGGEIFILDMGDPVKIIDLAKKIIKLSGYSEKEIPIVETGIRPGEKLYEELMVDSEETEQQVYEKIFVGKVTTMSTEKVLKFVSELNNCNEVELKSKLIKFANTRHDKFIEVESYQSEEDVIDDISKKIQTSY